LQAARIPAGHSDVDRFADKMQAVLRHTGAVSAQECVRCGGTVAEDDVKRLIGIDLLPNGEQEI